MDIYRCKLCNQAFNLKKNMPKLLPCAHTICHECSSGTNTPDQKKLVCPYDEREFYFDVKAYPTNYFLEDILK